MSSVSFKRAQAMTMRDRYNSAQSQFNSDLAVLIKRYFETESIVSDAYVDDTLKIVISVSVKRVK